MSIDALFREQYLTYDWVSTLKNSQRFWYQNLNNKIYIYDQQSLNIYTMSGYAAKLFATTERQEFSLILETMPWDEMKSTHKIFESIINTSTLDIPDVKNFVDSIHLNFSNQCNLACKYCFRDNSLDFRIADRSVPIRALEYLVYDCGKDATEYFVGYCYGGEPLLEFENLKNLIRYASLLSEKINKQIRIHFCTNGTILTEEMVKFLFRRQRDINISIDGNEMVNDAVRQYKNGKGTFSVIQSNIKKYQENNFRIHARSVITKNYPFPNRILNHLLDMGFDSISMKPIRSGNPLSFDKENIPQLLNAYKQLLEMFHQDLITERFDRIKKYKDDYSLRFIRVILLKQRVRRRCAWGRNQLVVNHLGEIFPCDSVLNIDRFKMGDVYTGVNWSQFSNLNVEERGYCKICWARNICGGTCFFSSWVVNNNISDIEPFECQLQKFLIENSLRLIFQLIDEKYNLNKLRTFFETIS